MKKPSLVWQFFDRVLHNGACVKVICKLCEKQYKFFGNTTNLRVHLSNTHPMQWDLLNSGTIDDSSLHESEDGSEKQTTPRKQKRSLSTRSADVYEPDANDIIQENENGQDEINLKLLQDRHSNIEWLDEEEISHFEVYEPNSKTPKKIKIKKEVGSPKRPKYFIKSKESKDQTRDEFSVFGEYIGNKLRNFTNPRTRGNIQQLITTILWQAEYGMYDDAESVKRLLRYSSQPTSSTGNGQVEMEDIVEEELEHDTETNRSLGLII